MFKNKEKQLYFDIAIRVSQQSYARRLKVGAVFVADSGMISIGYNGTLPGHDNNCENSYEVKHNEVLQGTDMYDPKTGKYHRLITKDGVLHAEENVIGKLLEEGVSAKGGSLFLTHAPCIHCAKLIARAKIAELYYLNEYRSNNGLIFLQEAGLYVEQYISPEICDN